MRGEGVGTEGGGGGRERRRACFGKARREAPSVPASKSCDLFDERLGMKRDEGWAARCGLAGSEGKGRPLPSDVGRGAAISFALPSADRGVF